MSFGNSAAIATWRWWYVTYLDSIFCLTSGLDIPSVELVLNYDIPRDPTDYIHRVGRTARAGRGGQSLCIVSEKDVQLIQDIEAKTSKFFRGKDDGRLLTVDVNVRYQDGRIRIGRKHCTERSDRGHVGSKSGNHGKEIAERNIVEFTNNWHSVSLLLIHLANARFQVWWKEEHPQEEETEPWKGLV